MPLMPRLSGLRLSVSNPAQLAEFYVTHLGMTSTEVGGNLCLGYAGEDADLVLSPGGRAYEHSSQDDYWKIGITVPNVDIAHTQLTAAGIEVSTPHQFRDIGYMCHLSDPAGLQIELLQHDFEGNRPAAAGDSSRPLGGGARIGQITLRSDGDTALPRCYTGLGLRCLSVQPVRDLGFILQFWSFSQDTPPHRDLEAVANREWLWKRPYTTLEIQCVDGLQPKPNPAYLGIEVAEANDALAGGQSLRNRVYFT